MVVGLEKQVRVQTNYHEQHDDRREEKKYYVMSSRDETFIAATGKRFECHDDS